MLRCLTLSLLLAACGDNLKAAGGDAAPPDATDGGVDVPIDVPVHAGAVTAIARRRNLTEAGEVTAPYADPAATFRLYDAMDNMVTPTVDADGTLRFSPVSAGAYLICDISFVTRPTCSVGSASAIDLDFFGAGRPDAVIGDVGTQLTLTVTGAAASTSASEFLDINNLNTNYADYGAPPTVPATPAIQTLNFRNRGLLAASDVLRVTHLVTRMSGSNTYVSADRAGSVTGISMQNSQNTVAAVNLATALTQATATFNLRLSQFAGIAGSPGPGAAFAASELDGFAEHPPHQFFPWLFQFIPPGATMADIPMTITYGQNPWGAATRSTFAVTLGYSVSVTAPGATSAGVITISTSAYRPISQLTGDITPRVSRITAPKVNGLDANLSQTGTTETPTISWTPPSLGTPTRYTVYLYRVLNQGGATIASASAQFQTTSTSLRIPPGFLTAGNAYTIGIRSEIVPGYDAVKPFATVLEQEVADTITAVHMP